MFPEYNPPGLAAPADTKSSAVSFASSGRSKSISLLKIGAGAANLHLPASAEGSRVEQAAVGVKLWVRLAQAPSHQMSALAARYYPALNVRCCLMCLVALCIVVSLIGFCFRSLHTWVRNSER